MPLTAAEKQRRYRQKLKDKDEVGEKEKERKRWAARQRAGKVKNIADLTPRQQRAKRKQWEINNERRRQEKLREKALPVLSSSEVEESQKVNGEQVSRQKVILPILF